MGGRFEARNRHGRTRQWLHGQPLQRRERLEPLAQAFGRPIKLSPVVEPCEELAREMIDSGLEDIVRKDRSSPYRDGCRAGWWKVKDRGWYEREAWRFERRRRRD